MNNPLTKTKTVSTHLVSVYIAGDYADALRFCRQYTTDVGLCVTVSEVDFAYSYGMESGVRIDLVNYPRFPSNPDDIDQRAFDLAEKLMYELCQRTALVVDPIATTWIYREDLHTARKTSI